MNQQQENNSSKDQQKQKRQPFWNLLLNIIIPVIILTKFSGPEHLGALWGLIIALAFPVGYGIIDFIQERKTNFLSILGLISVLLTGAVGLLELDPKWIAIKESSIPLIIGIIIIISAYTKYPLINKLLLNDMIMDTALVSSKLEENQKTALFEQKLHKASFWLAGSFFFSAILNYILAKVLVSSPAGTEAFNKEIGQMTAYSFPVIAVPSTILLMIVLWDLFKTLKKLTGLEMETILNTK